MKCQSLFAEKNKKNKFKMSSAEFFYPACKVLSRCLNCKLTPCYHSLSRLFKQPCLSRSNSVDPDQLLLRGTLHCLLLY